MDSSTSDKQTPDKQTPDKQTPAKQTSDKRPLKMAKVDGKRGCYNWSWKAPKVDTKG